MDSDVVERATGDDIDALVDAWVALAREQRDHDSAVLPEENRQTIRESIAYGVVEGTVLLVRARDVPVGDDGPADGHAGDDAVAGFVTVERETGRFRLADERGVVQNLYVRPWARNRGVGGALLAAAEATLRAAGVDVVRLEVLADNEAARRFYERHGYAPHRVQYEKRVRSESDSTPRGKR